MQAIVDKAPVVASAVLVSALHLLGNNAEIVKRWTNEIQEAVNSKSSMVQVCSPFHWHGWYHKPGHRWATDCLQQTACNRLRLLCAFTLRDLLY